MVEDESDLTILSSNDRICAITYTVEDESDLTILSSEMFAYPM